MTTNSMRGKSNTSRQRTASSYNKKTTTGKRKTTLRSRKKQRKLQQIKFTVTASIIIIVSLFLYLIIYDNVNDGGDKIANGVSVCNVDLSGMTKKQAKKALNNHLEKLGTVPMNFIVDDNKVDIKLSSLGFDIKDTTVKELVNEAYDYGKTGLLVTRWYKCHKAKSNEAVIDVAYQVDSATASAIFREKLPAFKGAAKNAQISVVDGKVKITKEKEGLVIDKKKTIKGVNTLLNDNWDEKSHKIKVSSKTGKADILKSDIEDIKDELGSFTTSYDANSTSAPNIECGTKHINGTIVLPDEEVSVDGLMAPYTADEGYCESGSYANGEVVQTMGGGICQCSTTLYNALLYSELEITKRFPHSMPIKYVSYGRDAAIASTEEGATKDLCFKNNTGYPIYIYGEASGGFVTFAIYGKEYRDSSRTVDYAYEILSDEELTTTSADDYVAQDGTVLKAKKDHKLTVMLYKYVYKNGVQVSRDEFSKSVYLVPDNTEGRYLNGERDTDTQEQE